MSTQNYAWGCDKLTAECDNCYLFRLSPRFGRDPSKVVLLSIERRVHELETWPPEKKIIFVNSMSDTFHEDIPFTVIDMWHNVWRHFPRRQFLVLTKRIGRAMLYYQRKTPPSNVWVGTSIGVKKTLPRMDLLLKTPAKVRFISFEPLLEDLGDFSLQGIHWAICGGESDPKNPRLMKPEWAENIRRICERDNVAYWFKQMGGKTKCSCHNEWGCSLLNGESYHEYPRFEETELVEA